VHVKPGEETATVEFDKEKYKARSIIYKKDPEDASQQQPSQIMIFSIIPMTINSI
jgi:hypothetical protein